MSESHMTDCGHKDQVAHLVDRFEQWKGYECPYCEIDRLRAALRELVECKDLKDRLDGWEAGSTQEMGAMLEEYCNRKPKAWDAARAVLAGASSSIDATQEPK